MRNRKLMGGVSLYLPLTVLAQINETVEGKSQSAKLRLCVEEGYRQLTKQANPSQNTDRGV
jgi:hypothetical protein